MTSHCSRSCWYHTIMNINEQKSTNYKMRELVCCWWKKKAQMLVAPWSICERRLSHRFMQQHFSSVIEATQRINSLRYLCLTSEYDWWRIEWETPFRSSSYSQPETLWNSDARLPLGLKKYQLQLGNSILFEVVQVVYSTYVNDVTTRVTVGEIIHEHATVMHSFSFILILPNCLNAATQQRDLDFSRGHLKLIN